MKSIGNPIHSLYDGIASIVILTYASGGGA